MSNRYDKLSSDEEYRILVDLLTTAQWGGDELTPRQAAEFILAIGDVYSTVREEFNNDILERFVQEQDEQGVGETTEDNHV